MTPDQAIEMLKLLGHIDMELIILTGIVAFIAGISLFK